MSSQTVVLRGTLQSDGILRLEKNPQLPAGPVEVTIRSLGTVSQAPDDWWQYLQQARAKLENAGVRFRTKEQIDADLEAIRSTDDRLDEIYRQVDEAGS